MSTELLKKLDAYREERRLNKVRNLAVIAIALAGFSIGTLVGRAMEKYKDKPAINCTAKEGTWKRLTT